MPPAVGEQPVCAKKRAGGTGRSGELPALPTAALQTSTQPRRFVVWIQLVPKPPRPCACLTPGCSWTASEWGFNECEILALAAVLCQGPCYFVYLGQAHSFFRSAFQGAGSAALPCHLAMLQVLSSPSRMIHCAKAICEAFPSQTGAPFPSHHGNFAQHT